jgi:ABC-type antimicrobial peptide transport system permease subunit
MILGIPAILTGFILYHLFSNYLPHNEVKTSVEHMVFVFTSLLFGMLFVIVGIVTFLSSMGLIAFCLDKYIQNEMLKILKRYYPHIFKKRDLK